MVGSGNTVWNGTAFDCRTSNNEIILPHSRSQFGLETVGTCNNGMIMGRNINRIFDGPNSTFISQLVIHLPLLNATDNLLDGRTVECIYDNGMHATNVGTHVIAYTRAGNICCNSLVTGPSQLF